MNKILCNGLLLIGAMCIINDAGAIGNTSQTGATDQLQQGGALAGVPGNKAEQDMFGDSLVPPPLQPGERDKLIDPLYVGISPMLGNPQPTAKLQPMLPGQYTQANYYSQQGYPIMLGSQPQPTAPQQPARPN